MNQKLHSLALTKDQTDLLQMLSRNQLVAGVHVAVTAAALPAKQRTFSALREMDAHMALCDMLKWRTTDSGRAYRSVGTAVVVKMMELLSGAVTEIMDKQSEALFQRIAPELHQVLQKSLEAPSERVNGLTQFRMASA
jgi:hypothetical protein